MHLARGQAAEKQALHYLKQQGLILVTQNFRRRYGEIDLIMQDQDILVFVEVRYRRQSSYGSALDSVSYPKQTKLHRAAACYLQRYKQHDIPECRFDVVAIDGMNHIEWLKNAF